MTKFFINGNISTVLNRLIIIFQIMTCFSCEIYTVWLNTGQRGKIFNSACDAWNRVQLPPQKKKKKKPAWIQWSKINLPGFVIIPKNPMPSTFRDKHTHKTGWQRDNLWHASACLWPQDSESLKAPIKHNFSLILWLTQDAFDIC